MSRDIVAAIDSVIAAHLKATGRTLHWREAARRADRFHSIVFEGQPWACRVVCLLVSAGYSDEAVWQAVGHIHATGSARGCAWPNGEPVLDDQDVLNIDSDDAFRPVRVAVREDSGRIVAIRPADVPDADLAALAEAQDFAEARDR